MIALQSLIERAARMNPTGVATTYKGTNLTWADTEHRVASLASGLQQLGFSEGDRVGILSLNCAKYYEALFAVPWACLLYTSPSPRDISTSRMPSSA